MSLHHVDVGAADLQAGPIFRRHRADGGSDVAMDREDDLVHRLVGRRRLDLDALAVDARLERPDRGADLACPLLDGAPMQRLSREIGHAALLRHALHDHLACGHAAGHGHFLHVGARTLAPLGDEAVPAIAENLQPRQSRIQRGGLDLTLAETASTDARCAAVWALTRIDHPKARAAVRGVLRDGNFSVRLAAIHSAGLWRDAAALPDLLESLQAQIPAIQRAAAEALREHDREPRLRARVVVRGHSENQVAQVLVTDLEERRPLTWRRSRRWDGRRAGLLCVLEAHMSHEPRIHRKRKGGLVLIAAVLRWPQARRVRHTDGQPGGERKPLRAEKTEVFSTCGVARRVAGG